MLIGVDKTGGLPRLKDAARGALLMKTWADAQGFDAVHVFTDEQGPVTVDAIKRVVADGGRRVGGGAVHARILARRGAGCLAADQCMRGIRSARALHHLCISPRLLAIDISSPSARPSVTMAVPP